MSKETQNQQIKKHLETKKFITPLDALSDYGCMRLSGRIFELRKLGMNIKTTINKSGKHYAIYHL